jgi:pimeloyl-ACP methyl ester carboxylesterase
MSIASVITGRGWLCPGCLALLSASVVLALPTAGLAAEGASGRVIGHDAYELRAAGTYEVGKVPVVLVHGLLGSPDKWSVMIDRLSGDPAVRAHFQFLTFSYDSLQSITESGFQLAEALDEARRRFDPEGRDPSFDQVILVGHSLGGLVAKAASGDLDRQRKGALRAPSDEGGLLRAPRVGRFVFIATPHRGATINRGAIRSVGNWLARNLRPPSAVQGAQVSSVDQLAWEYPLLSELERTRAAESTPFHSIIAALGDPSADGATDGVVPVVSARLGGARSEVLFRTNHFCFAQPEVIGEVRKILMEYASQPTGPAPDTASRAGSVSSVSISIPALAAGRGEHPPVSSRSAE